MKRLARHTKLPRRLAYRKTESRKDVLAQDGPGMGRLPHCSVFHCPFAGHIGSHYGRCIRAGSSLSPHRCNISSYMCKLLGYRKGAPKNLQR